VLEEKIKHISYVPSSPEPYYPVTGNECQPKPSGDEFGVVVYQYTPISAVNYVTSKSLVELNRNNVFFSLVDLVLEVVPTSYPQIYALKKTVFSLSQDLNQVI